MSIWDEASEAAGRGVTRLMLGTAAAALAASATPAAAALVVTDDPALYWSSLVSSTMVGSPITTSRTIAMAQTAIYEAANATTGTRYRSYLGFGASTADTRAAVAVAARNVLVAVNPSRTADYDAALAATMALVPDGAAKTEAIALGNAIAAAAIARRSNDGSNLTVPYMPQAPGTPGAWQPTPPGNLPGALPHWQNVTPWVMTGTDQFLPAPPPALDSAAWALDFNEVKAWGGTVSALRTADQMDNAVIWASTTSSRSAVLPWQDVGIDLAKASGMGTAEAARMLALLQIGNADTIISLWDAKYHYDFWRPVTAIRNADVDGNALTLTDAGWSSSLTTPNYPSHSSGVAAVAGNAQTVLTSFFGDSNSFCIVAAAGQRCYDSFTAAATAAGEARIHGGMHYRFEVEAGLLQGRSIANFALGNALGVVPEPQTWALLILGFGMIGGTMRHRRANLSVVA